MFADFANVYREFNSARDEPFHEILGSTGRAGTYKASAALLERGKVQRLG